MQGQIQFLRGQTADAVKTFRTVAARKPPSPVAYDFLARALFAAKDLITAEGAAQKAVDLDPASPEARRVLVELQLEAGKPDAALAEAQAYAKSTSSPDADLLLADTLLRLKRTADAQAQLEKSLAARPDARLAIRLSQIAIQSGNNGKAKAIVNDWLKTHPNDVEVRNFDAGWLMASGDTAGARAAYESLLAMRPNDPVALNNLASLLQKQDPARALALATTAARIAPASAPIADTLGWTKHLRGDPQGALPLLQHAHELQSEDPAISYHLAVVLRDSGKQAEAKTLLQTTLAKSPKFDGVEEAKKLLATW
jgi:Flp pilus assembly protein TadD